MGDTVRLTAADNHQLDAYRAEASGASAGGIVIVQEIFGVTPHIKRVVDQYAAEGFTAVAPAMFDRVERGVDVDYSDAPTGRAIMQQLDWQNTVTDTSAAVESVRAAGPVFVVGYCWGGTVAYVAASDLDITAAVSYYGGGIARLLEKTPKCPIMYHFGEEDQAIPLSDVEKIRETHPSGTFYVYDGAGHGFNCEDRASYHPEAAKQALERSLSFIREHL